MQYLFTHFQARAPYREYDDCVFEHLNTSGVSAVKNLPAMQQTWVRFLGWEDTLEKGMATHSSIHAWERLWTEEPGGLQYMGSQRVSYDLASKPPPLYSQQVEK